MKKQSIAFIGAGNMARAIIAGLLKTDVDPKRIWASSPTILSRAPLSVHVTTDNFEAAKQADIIVLGVKPWAIEALCQELKSIIHEKKPLIISLAAGVKTESIARFCEAENIALVRTMPNIASAVGAGVTGLFANAFVTSEQKTAADNLFQSVGSTVWVEEENQLDVITVISGSGPAYFFYFFEAMQATAESLGLSSEKAKALVAATAQGAAKMVMERAEPFMELRRQVTSEKGVTAAATSVFDENKVKEIIDTAMRAALTRAQELAK